MTTSSSAVAIDHGVLAELDLDPDRVSATAASAHARLEHARRRVTTYHTQFHSIDVVVSLFQGRQLSDRAARLVQRTYGRLGYDSDRAIVSSRSNVSLEATVGNRLVGTLSVTLDSPEGIQAEELYAEEIAPFRNRGPVCEFTRLAVQGPRGGHEALCSLFYVAYVYAHLLCGATQLFIEVNPRHVRFYQRMLGFRPVAAVKTCPRVNAPAVLLHLDFPHTRDQIAHARIAARGGESKLYQYAGSVEQELELLHRIRLGLNG